LGTILTGFLAVVAGPAIVGFILYWLIRLAVRHGIRDSQK